eukprot:TRINITY_DN1528_c0_g1_i2.p1 TRINITY_DN1528_c0_g1~~TRINITY_DN1528_c0_g1_i2.p1  ORF type:complete len:288 (+),score=75.57 TRINITY_DN1528_c0_g1_i2:66-929(+)
MPPKLTKQGDRLNHKKRTQRTRTRYTQEELAHKKEVEAVLKEVHGYYGGDVMQYEEYRDMLRVCRVCEGVKGVEGVLKKTRPPSGRGISWDDFNICLKILAIHKYPDADSEDASDRLIVDIVEAWLTMHGKDASCTSSALPSYVNGISRSLALPLEQPAFHEPIVLTVSEPRARSVKKSESVARDAPTTTTASPEIAALYEQLFVPTPGNTGKEKWTAFCTEVYSSAGPRYDAVRAAGCWDEAATFATLLEKLGEILYPMSHKEVQMQFVLQVGLNHMGTPLGIGDV